MDLTAMSDALQKGKANEVKEYVTKALAEGLGAKRILEEGLISGMSVVGARFKRNEIYIPEVLIAARAMQAGMSILEPELVKSGVKMIGKVAIGTVKGDLHDIGKNLVAMMFKGAGFEVLDLGVDVPAEKFVATAVDHQADLVGMSALLTTTMMQMKTTVEMVKKAGFQGVKTIVGGAPVTAEFAKQIGADGYAPDAATAVSIVKGILGVK